ncbi:hypothetical protein RLJV_23940 [Pseudomonas aeruginosa]|nr:hypothetical protein RLJV_23940 [Pseudomonas aeruginosa]
MPITVGEAAEMNGACMAAEIFAISPSSSTSGGVRLGDVQHADLQLLVGLGVVDQVVQAAPGAFQLLEVGVVHDQVDLRGA